MRYTPSCPVYSRLWSRFRCVRPECWIWSFCSVCFKLQGIGSSLLWICQKITLWRFAYINLFLATIHFAHSMPEISPSSKVHPELRFLSVCTGQRWPKLVKALGFSLEDQHSSRTAQQPLSKAINLPVSPYHGWPCTLIPFSEAGICKGNNSTVF